MPSLYFYRKYNRYRKHKKSLEIARSLYTDHMYLIECHAVILWRIISDLKALPLCTHCKAGEHPTFKYLQLHRFPCDVILKRNSGYLKEGRITTGYGTERQRKIPAVNIIAWTQPKISNSWQNWTDECDRGFLKANVPLGRKRWKVHWPQVNPCSCRLVSQRSAKTSPKTSTTMGEWRVWLGFMTYQP